MLLNALMHSLTWYRVGYYIHWLLLALRLSKLTKYHNIIQAERNLEGKEREEQIVEKAVEMAGATKMLIARVPKKEMKRERKRDKRV